MTCCCGSHAARSMDLFINWLDHWLIDGLIDWLIDWLVDWLIDWLIGWLVDWLIDWLVDWLIDWLIDWLTDVAWPYYFEGTGFIVDWLIFSDWKTTLIHLTVCILLEDALCYWVCDVMWCDVMWCDVIVVARHAPHSDPQSHHSQFVSFYQIMLIGAIIRIFSGRKAPSV